MLLICVWYCVSFLSHLEQPCHFCVLLPHSYLFAQTEPEPITPEVALVQSAGHNTYAEGQVSCEDLAGDMKTFNLEASKAKTILTT